MRILFYSLCCVFVFSCKSIQPISAESGSKLIAIESAAGDSISHYFYTLTKLYRDSLGKEMNEVLFVNPRPMNRSGRMDSLNQKRLWNWITDALLWYSKDSLNWESNLCLLNKGGFRRDIDSGKVRMMDIFELLPFENYLVEVTLDSLAYSQMKTYLLQNIQPQSGLQMGFINDSLVSIDSSLSPSQGESIKVLTINYLADGGDYMSFFKDKPRKTSSVLIRDAMIAYLRAFPNQFPTIDSRTYVIE